MVDTIVLRIHNIKAYKLLYEQFQPTNSSKNIIVEGTAVVDEDGVVTEKNVVWQRIKAFSKSGKFLPSVISFDFRSPSSNYMCRGCIRCLDTYKAFLEVEFSIPKYFYGTNVFQLVSMPPNSSEANFYYLLKALRRFMRDSFNQLPKDHDIEIFRIDMCYNQFHKSKADALNYHGIQREWMKRYADGKNMRLVDSSTTTWTLLTQRYSFKCYHKGTEFAENDYKELVRVRGKHSYDLSKLQRISDCVLRYEITYRNTMLQYLTMYYTFQDLEKKKGYLLDSNLYNYLKRVQKRGSFAASCIDLNMNVKEDSPVDYFAGKQKKFCLKSVFDSGYSPLCVFSESVTFNYKVYRLLFDWFWNKVKLSQPDEGVPVFKMVEKIQTYQAKLKSYKESGSYSAAKVKKGNLREVAKKNTARILVPALLSQFMDVRKLKDYIPQATYYRLLKDFNLIGLPLKNGMQIINKAPLDYSDNAAMLEPLKKNFVL